MKAAPVCRTVLAALVSAALLPGCAAQPLDAASDAGEAPGILTQTADDLMTEAAGLAGEPDTSAPDAPADEGAAVPDDAQAAGDTADAADAAAASPTTAQGDAPAAPAAETSRDRAADKPSAPSSEKQTHSHDWQPVTEQRWVSNWVTVTDQAAWDEPVYKTVNVCACGAEFSSAAAAAAHNEEYAIQGIGGHPSSSVKKQVDTIHHSAQTHDEDRGWYETVTVGQRCSCGATK